MLVTSFSIDRLKTPLPAFKLISGQALAGSSLRNHLLGEPVSDYDIFVDSKELATEFIKANEALGITVVHTGDRVVSLKTSSGVKVQAIIQPSFNIAAIGLSGLIEQFDFTVTQFATQDMQNVVCSPASVIDSYEKRLVINRLPMPIDTLRRLQKYIQRGYTICDGGLNTLVEGIRALTPDEAAASVEFYSDGRARIARYD